MFLLENLHFQFMILNQNINYVKKYQRKDNQILLDPVAQLLKQFLSNLKFLFVRKLFESEPTLFSNFHNSLNLFTTQFHCSLEKDVFQHMVDIQETLPFSD